MSSEHTLEDKIYSIIGTYSRNPQIDMGVKRESYDLPAIYVNFDDSEGVQSLYSNLLSLINQPTTKKEAVESIYEAVTKHFEHTKVSEVDSVVQRKGETKISLDEFVNKRAGTCLPTTLVAALMLERLGSEGIMGIDFRIETFDDNRYGHVWLVAETEEGDTVLDIVSGFLGSYKKYKESVISELIDAP